jgi:hypothetical protein
MIQEILCGNGQWQIKCILVHLLQTLLVRQSANFWNSAWCTFMSKRVNWYGGHAHHLGQVLHAGPVDKRMAVMLSRLYYQFSSRYYRNFATQLLHLSNRTNIVVICKENVNLSWHVNFMVHWAKVKAILEYMIAHDSDHTDLIINHNVLRQLPENGSVANCILNNYHTTQILAKWVPLLLAVHIILTLFFFS